MNRILAGVLVSCGLTVSSAQAALVDRGGGMIYDDVLGITWLADANYAFTSGYAAANVGGLGSNVILADGRMGFDAANTWANNLVYGGYSNWQLPTSFNFDGTGQCVATNNCTKSHLGHMYYTNMGATAFGGGILTQGDPAKLALFQNIQEASYWFREDNVNFGWSFNNDFGTQDFGFPKGNTFYAWAVRDGDVAPPPVPLPAAAWLLLSGLGGLGLLGRRRAGRAG